MEKQEQSARWIEVYQENAEPAINKRIWFCSSCYNWQNQGKLQHCPSCGVKMSNAEYTGDN